ncbi:MAG: hypothetical protein QG660_198 [Pseudomonadota bacterium]|nr:hypothetical protein [Pseudomonadota bacterium]
MARQGLERRGRQGSEPQDAARPVVDWQARRGRAGSGMARRGVERQAWQGAEWRGKAWRGPAGKEMNTARGQMMIDTSTKRAMA